MFSLSTLSVQLPQIAALPGGVEQSEVDALALSVTAAHSQDAVNIACLVHMTRAAFGAYGASAGVSLLPLLDLQREYIRAWMKVQGVDRVEVLAALADLERAGETVGYLHTIPA